MHSVFKLQHPLTFIANDPPNPNRGNSHFAEAVTNNSMSSYGPLPATSQYLSSLARLPL